VTDKQLLEIKRSFHRWKVW